MKTLEDIKKDGWESGINHVWNADCLEALKLIPDKSIDLVVTDPPYGVNYEGGHNKNKREKLVNDEKPVVYGQLFNQIHRLLKDGSGGAYVFYATSCEHEVFKNIPLKYQCLIWNKTNATFASFNARYHHVYEPFLYLTNGSPTKWNGGTQQRSIWNFKKSNTMLHPTQKPIDLINKMILNSSNEDEIVLDPFLGSGTTAVAAKHLGRKFIGIEISKKYCEIAEKRLAQGVLF